MPEEWQGSVVTNLSHADSSHRQAADNIFGGITTVRSTNAEHSRQRDSVHSHFAQKICNTQELAQQLSTRIHSVKKTTQHTEWSLSKLQAAMQALASPTEACKNRLHLRQKLPKRERVFDSFQEALLREERELQLAKQRYNVAIADTQRVLRELQTRQQELEHDLRDKRHALSLDHACIDKKTMETVFPSQLDKCYSRKGGTPIKGVLPELATVGTPGETPPETDGREQERTRQKYSLRNIDQALGTEDAARARWAETSDLLAATQKALSAAHKATQSEMASKVEHTEVLRQELVKQSKATSQKISDMQKYMGLATDKLMAIEKPLSANAQRERIRSCRTPREAICDQVSEALHSQMHALQGKKLQLQSQASTMQDTLHELEHTNRMLIDDIADKEKALAIDRSCAGVKNAAHSSYSYGFAKVGQGQRQFADTASSMMRQTHPLHTAR
eukprot:CAMPEP_0115232788 /NCGR_PEP_ID=MMETSP0270-20121206/33945_1 /TAXON_ID=71861 /ORGANISM="Scrippsiella trochoidea, Strain CCMP3099" /LENGTH=447 /DNA_ID=CAMNT_0002647489 /DNA_START=110 /DNA_END=1453 /DNA_ORIENTATION=-